MTDVMDRTEIPGRDGFGASRGTQYGAVTASWASDDETNPAADSDERARAFRLVVLRDLM